MCARYWFVAAVYLALATGPAWAGSDSTTFQVTATVNDTCRVDATDMSFGDYDPNNTSPTTATSRITATCTPNTRYEIGLDRGQHGGNANNTTRAMAANGDYLDYDLYLSAARTTPWTPIGGGNTRLNPSAAGGANPETVYGQIPAGEYVPAGSYADMITVRINF